MTWIDALSAVELEAKGKAVVRHEGRQVLVMRTPKGIFACTNRCPHEGYPLSEGVLTEGHVLTCNWHNWKFDLASGKTLVGGDRLPHVPVEIREGRVWLDIAAPDPEAIRAKVLAALPKALEDVDQQRLVREVARLAQISADPVDAIRSAVDWAADRLEFGTTHAVAGAPGWLALYDRAQTGADEKLAALGEILGHFADDVRGPERYPFAAGRAPWDEARFLAAIEAEDEATAIALLRGGLAEGLSPSDLLPTLVAAGLAHYADFGHSLIYAVKTVELARRLGAASAEPLLSMLVRSLIYAAREDRLPEFRDYAAHHGAWGRAASAKAPPLEAAALRGKSPKSAMAVVAAWSARYTPEAIFAVLVEASAWILLHVDARVLTRIDAALADNVGWLDFTHALTFADAARTAVAVRPQLWPNALLQLACFIGRNNGYVDPDLDVRPYAVSDGGEFLAQRTSGLFDHGRDRFIISVHLIKTLLAGEALIAALPDKAPLIAAALNRFLDAPMKGRHVLRTARQMRDLVAQE
ncbi:MAG TPA: Rieske (2Fe-2S) protein [Stellaceae bacterium]|nr:Rieske (2Fe-2S) protein [Stellaceae bacterium]